MKVVTAPNKVESQERPFIFLAGGITNCPLWRIELIELLENEKGTLINPRRKNFPIHDPNASKEQITWEYNMLNKVADAISFWFSIGSNNPIVLFELGCHSNRYEWKNSPFTVLRGDPFPIFVGVHPQYERKRDVEIQMELRQPYIRIVYSLNDLADQIREFVEEWNE